MESAFDNIKAARALLIELQKSEVGEATLRGYNAECMRLFAKSGGKIAGVIEAARDTKSSSTWYRRKAALVAISKHNLGVLLKRQDNFQREMKAGNPAAEAEFDKTVRQLSRVANLIMQVRSAGPLPEEGRKIRSSKKRSLRGLPEDWRADLARRFSPKYKLPFLVAAATGCRPAELAKGIKLAMDRDEKTGITSIRVTIPGAKVREMTGQPERRIFIAMDGIEGSIASQLADAIRSGVDHVNVASEKLFSGAVRDAGRREWKGRRLELSAYSLRHQFSADLKAADTSDDDIARALGHVTTKTASYYGDRRQGRGSGGVKLDGVEATRKIRKTAKHKAIP